MGLGPGKALGSGSRVLRGGSRWIDWTGIRHLDRAHIGFPDVGLIRSLIEYSIKSKVTQKKFFINLLSCWVYLQIIKCINWNKFLLWHLIKSGVTPLFFDFLLLKYLILLYYLLVITRNHYFFSSLMLSALNFF